MVDISSKDAGASIGRLHIDFDRAGIIARNFTSTLPHLMQLDRAEERSGKFDTRAQQDRRYSTDLVSEPH